MRRNIAEGDEEAIRIKEQSILELGSLFVKTRQADGVFYVSTIKQE